MKSAVSFTVFLFFLASAGGRAAAALSSQVWRENLFFLRISCEKMSETDLTACTAVLML